MDVADVRAEVFDHLPRALAALEKGGGSQPDRAEVIARETVEEVPQMRGAREKSRSSDEERDAAGFRLGQQFSNQFGGALGRRVLVVRRRGLQAHGGNAEERGNMQTSADLFGCRVRVARNVGENVDGGQGEFLLVKHSQSRRRGLFAEGTVAVGKERAVNVMEFHTVEFEVACNGAEIRKGAVMPTLCGKAKFHACSSS